MKQYEVYKTDFLPKPSELPNGTLYGNFSATLPQGIKLVPYQHLRFWGDQWDTETAFTRQFMRTLPKKKARKSTFISYMDSRPPVYTLPGYLPDAVYIDLTAAYPSIYRLWGWGLEYAQGKF